MGPLDGPPPLLGSHQLLLAVGLLQALPGLLHLLLYLLLLLAPLELLQDEVREVAPPRHQLAVAAALRNLATVRKVKLVR